MLNTLAVNQRELPGVSWKLLTADHEEVFPQVAVRQGLDLLQKWSALFPSGNTWVGGQYKVPSLIVRLDCVVHNDKLSVYEVEDRPCGIGVGSCTNPFFKERLDALRKEWPKFAWVKAPGRETDDFLWLGEGLTLEEAKRSDELLLVRSRPEDREFHQLEPRAISTVQHEGDKRCGVDPALSLYTLLKWVEDASEQSGGYISPQIPMGPFVVKPWKGTRAREVKVCLNGHAVANGITVAKKEKMSIGDLERWLRAKRVAICQPLIPPMRNPLLPTMNVIWRMFFGYSPSRGSYVPMGGMWMAKSSLVVHGDDTSVSGPLLFEE